jgi:hypothetical protein
MKYIYCFFVLLIFGCSGSPNVKSDSTNTQLLVHYNNVEVHRRSPYISQKQLANLLSQNQELVVIFSADYCNACKITKKALKQANLKKPIYYLNIQELWVQKLVVVLGIERLVPLMLHVDKKGNLITKRIGPESIVTYIITKFD